jgi:hypothetical protein
MKEFNIISAAELMKEYVPLPCPTDSPPLTLQQIIRIEPRIAEMLNALKPSRKHFRKRLEQYYEVKRKLSKPVGWQAEQFALRTSQAYDVILDTVIEKLKM